MDTDHTDDTAVSNDNGTGVSAKTRQRDAIPYRGTQARQRAAEKVREVLCWLHESHVIDAAIVGELLEVGRSESHATLSRLQRMNLVQRVPVSSCPVTPWILTRAGLEVVCSLLEPEDMTATPPIHPSRVQTATVAHDLLAQHLTLYVMGRIGPWVAEALSDEVMQISPEMIQVTRWAFDPVLRRNQERYAGKIPDAIIEAGDDSDQVHATIAIEMQESYAPMEVARRVLSQYCDALTKYEVDLVVFGSTRPAVLEYYRKLLEGEPPPYLYNAGRKQWFSVDGAISPATPEIRGRFRWVDLQYLAGRYYLMRL